MKIESDKRNWKGFLAATDEIQIKHRCGQDGSIRKAGNGEGPTTDGQRINTDTEKSLNKRERRLAAKESRKRKKTEITSAACGLEVGGGRKRWAGKCANLDQGGQKVGKQTGFAHLEFTSTRLGPDNSMQVVDFPHLGVVRVFWGSHEILKAVKSTEISEASAESEAWFAKILNYDSIRAFVNKAGAGLSILVRDGEITAAKSQKREIEELCARIFTES